MSEALLEVASWVTRLGELGDGLVDTERIGLITALEVLKGAAAAAQARVTAGFAASQRQAMTADGVPVAQQARSIGAQVALARKISPRQGSRHLGLAEALVGELPHVLAALAAGETSEWRATLVARETACLTRDDRVAVDRALAQRPGGIGSMGDADVAREARRVAYRLDPGAALRRSARAVSQRCVTLRPAPDAMAYVTALLPVAGGVAAHVALGRAADTARAHGDSRSRGQVMADLFTDRLLHPGGSAASSYDPTRWDAPPPQPVPEPGGESGHGAPAGVRVEVHVVMTDAALLGDDDAAAEVVGLGPVPASVARALVRDAPEGADVWVRRLYTSASSGDLVAMDSRARHFPTLLRRFLVVRDEVCRTPWCGAPVRHTDHVVPHADGGRTRLENGQGLCEGCNQVKEAAGWNARPRPDGSVVTTTPTGHAWTSLPRVRWRPPPRVTPDDRVCDEGAPSVGEERLRRLLAVA